jgi:hypothetical protein
MWPELKVELKYLVRLPLSFKDVLMKIYLSWFLLIVIIVASCFLIFSSLYIRIIIAVILITIAFWDCCKAKSILPSLWSFIKKTFDAITSL